jgi:hypothetical protein
MEIEKKEILGEMTPEDYRSNKIFLEHFGPGGTWDLSVKKAVENCISSKIPEHLWYYCSVKSLEAILKSKNMFMSNIQSMNDYKEGEWITDRLISKIISHHPELSGFIPYLNNYNVDFLQGPYVASFSSNGDLLSQWRGYGNDGKGVSIGIKGDKISIPLISFDNETLFGRTFITNVIYDEVKQDKIIERLINLVKLVVDAASEAKFNPNNHPYLYAATRIKFRLYFMAPMFKNPSFKEEGEWRIIGYPASSMSISDENNIYSINMNKFGDNSDFKFRSSDNDIIDYITFPSVSSINSMIDAINLGPACILKKKTLAMFVSEQEIKSITIEKSKSTLRPT